MKLIYLGSPEIAVPPLRALHDAGHQVVLVVTGPDKRRGHGGGATPTPVKAAAIELGLNVTDDPDDLLSVEADLGVVVAYGRLLRPHLLEALDMVNLHFSLLPRWRGATPVERALLAGDPVTGVCLMKVDEGLDTGCVYDSVEVPIHEGATAAELRDRLVEAGTTMLVRALSVGLGPCTPQPDDGMTYATKLATEDLRVDWAGPASSVDRTVRVGGAWTTFRGQRVKVHEVAPLHDGMDRSHDGVDPGTVVGDPRSVRVWTGDGLVELVTVQPPGKAPMAATAWANGAQPFGERLGEHPDTEGPGSVRA